jgi:hypothetical protein
MGSSGGGGTARGGADGAVERRCRHKGENAQGGTASPVTLP